MAGGIMQLVAYGAQDLYLTGNPQMTFFKVVYNRYTNYANEYIKLYFHTNPNFDVLQFNQAYIKVKRQADLLGDCYFVVDMPPIYADYQSGFNWVPYLGYSFIHYISMEINGQEIDKNYGQWLIVWTELTMGGTRKRQLLDMISYREVPFYSNTQTFNDCQNDSTANDQKILIYPKKRLYVPLQFSFCSDPGLFLPLISIQYQEVFFFYEFRPMNNLFTIGSQRWSPQQFFSQSPSSFSNPNDLSFYNKCIALGINEGNIFSYFLTPSNGTIPIADAWIKNTYMDCNYIYLDNDEQKLFATNSQEYLITQIQYRYFDGLLSGPNTLEIKINHPVKEMIWTFSRADYYLYNDYTNFTSLPNIGRFQSYQNAIRNGGLFSSNSFLSFIVQNENFATLMNNIRTIGLSTLNNITDDTINILQVGKFIFNGRDRFNEKDFIFFENLQKFKYHSGTNELPGINAYSFSLQPENLQPSGSVNMSRINRFQFQFSLKPYFTIDQCNNSGNIITGTRANSTVLDDFAAGVNYDPNSENQTDNKFLLDTITTLNNLYHMDFFAINYNILRITGGMANIVFAN